VEYQKKFRRWADFTGMDVELGRELALITSDEEEIDRRFSQDITFGTGGIRGRMGAGTALINIYTVRKATAGLASYLLNNRRQEEDQPSVVIAFDTRHNSERFTRETAAVLTARGIKTYIFPEPVPVPLLSFAVRELQASAGVVITASHNPPADNGYKVYGSDGGQITQGSANAITAEIIQVEDELAIPAGNLATAEKDGLLEWVGTGVYDLYFKLLQGMSLTSAWWGGGPLPVSVVYTPLHGTGGSTVPRALANAGVRDVILVAEQMKMDPHCSTVKYPNPEDWEVFNLAIELGLKEQADMLLATDLDCDRLGVAVCDYSGQYVPLTGNQLGCLMLDYILARKKERGDLQPNGIAVQTVVTSALGKAIAAAYGVETVETLTGFKYIGEVIKERVDSGQNYFLFGFEESYGYLAGDFVRDKDGIQAAQLAVELTAYYKNRGMTILDALEQLYRAYGYYREELVNLELAEGEIYRVEQAMTKLRGADWREPGGLKIIRVDDYLQQLSTDLRTGEQIPTGLPASNAVKYFMERDCWFCVRPSGTEPKIKIYFGVKGESAHQAATLLNLLKERVLPMVKKD
jgi:phosphoglucomutase